MKTKLLKLKWFVYSLENWLRGYKFGPVSRCRVCDHTAYTPHHPEH